jgi:hypothetical protein
VAKRSSVRARVRGALGALACAALILALAPSGVSRSGRVVRVSQRDAAAVSVAVETAHSGRPVPQNFLGLSFELSSLAQIADHTRGGNLVTLLRSLGVGVLRFGGISSDTRTAWADAIGGRPAWAANVVEAADLRQLGSVAAQTGWQVLLTIGLVHDEPGPAAREAAVAKQALGSSLQGIELGNEPNAYAAHDLRSEPWTVGRYDGEVAAYREAIAAVTPGIPLAGPDVSGSVAFDSWAPSVVSNQRPALLTGHHYPLGCHQIPAPSIHRLLSPPIRASERASLRRYMRIARASETPFRLDETGSVSCGGRAGISDAFASALWAVGYVTRAMTMGVAGINLEGNPALCGSYTPLCAHTPAELASGTLNAQPAWYALLLTKALVGDRPLRVITSSRDHPNVQVTAFAAPGGALRFVVVNDDPRGRAPVTVRLHVGGAFGGARVLALAAPSLAARSGVTLGGRPVAPNGSWTEPEQLPHTSNRGGVITFHTRAASAALLTVSRAAR